MRYAAGGGLTARERERRERVRLEAAARFARGEKSRTIATDLRVTERAVERWRRAWREGGPAGLRSKGPASLPRLSVEQFARLERELERGPLAHGFTDQRWTLMRIKSVIGRLFHVGYTVQGVWKLLRRNGWSCQRPARRAIERDDAAIEVWKKQVWPGVERARRPATAGSSSKTRPDSRSRPPRARTWGRRGITPVVRVRGKGSGRVHIAAMVCYKPGQRSRLIYRLHVDRGRKGERRSFDWTDYRDLIITAHLQLAGPIVLVWDNLNLHLVPPMREFIAANETWLTVFQLPAYAPDLNPSEGIWSLLKRGVLANLAAAGLDHLVRVTKRGLKKIQYRPHLIDGCLAETGLALTAN